MITSACKAKFLKEGETNLAGSKTELKLIVLEEGSTWRRQEH